MFFVPGYIVNECQEGEGQKLFQSWKQAIRERNSESKRAAELALAGHFRSRRRGERDQQAAAFLESLGSAVERCPEVGVVRQEMERKRGKQQSRKRTGSRAGEHWQQWK